MKFLEMTSPQLGTVDREQTLVLIPIAACEQHGSHLPTGTDTIICQSLAEAVEQRLPDSILLVPIMWLGASSHHLRFGATLTAELDTYIQMLIEIAEPLIAEGYRRFMILNGHGGNVDPLRVALRQLQTPYPHVLLSGSSYWSIAEQQIAETLTGADKTVGHACEAETSLIMHLRPELVDRERLADAGPWTRDVVEGLYICRDMQQRTREGCTGRPDLATAEKGARLFDQIVTRVTSVAEMLLRESLPE
jgi:creatinine amidohydrolase